MSGIASHKTSSAGTPLQLFGQVAEALGDFQPGFFDFGICGSSGLILSFLGAQ